MRHSQHGFSLIELVVAISIFLVVSAAVLDGLMNVSKVSATVANRTQMHAGVRNATELLQQEVGQAGRVALPNRVRLAAAAAQGNATVALEAIDAAGNVLNSASAVKSMFVGEKLVVGTGSVEETVTLTGVNALTNQITAAFAWSHAIHEPIQVYGGFASGVVPTNATNGSTGSVLKMFGDVNSDGNIEYVEYTCDTAGGNLYRRAVAFDAAIKPALSPEQSLLNNVVANPDGTPCFTYQQQAVSGTTFVVDVAITLTVRTPDPDPQTGIYQYETKALLNVSPRNVFNVWQMAGLGISSRVQPMPQTVATLTGLP
ncbi:MAG: type II secretion system protein J [Vicinamibacterales bacterium]